MSVIGMNEATWKTTAHATACSWLTPYTASANAAAPSNTPTNPGADGTATPTTITPWTNSVAQNGTWIPTALNPNQKASGWRSQCNSVHQKTAMKCRGVRSTL